ncbi:hypothetical protein GPECTOR_31g288 [Gonium pectorale]|uniref:Uncharacterized protein n=1 Tax=Gonium pectorale TaxID=33097 RepID=A0A150GDL6_GONPE|nr:hypothetical protein GPECTOR_31g288 [Gonium pectorale]|eukprot:KXZ47926.1 hypothetical protein GPECTOR_31g288 [Gonium pectorale]
MYGMHGRYLTNLTVSLEHVEEYFVREPQDGSETLTATSPLSAKGLFLQLTPAYRATVNCTAGGARRRTAGGGGTAAGGTAGGTGPLFLYRLHVTVRGCQAFRAKRTPASPSGCTAQAGCQLEEQQVGGGRRSCLLDALESVEAAFAVAADTGEYRHESLCLTSLTSRTRRAAAGRRRKGAPSCCLGAADCAEESAAVEEQLEACAAAAAEEAGGGGGGFGSFGDGAGGGPSSSSSGKRGAGSPLLGQVVNVFGLLARQTHIRRTDVSEELPVEGTVYKEKPPQQPPAAASAAAGNETGAGAAAADGSAAGPRRRLHQLREGAVAEPAPYVLNSQTDIHPHPHHLPDGSSGGGGRYTIQRSFLVPTDLAHEAMEESGAAEIAAGAGAAAADGSAAGPRRRLHQLREGAVAEPAPYVLNSQTDIHPHPHHLPDGSSGGGGRYTIQRSFLVPTDLAHEAMEESGAAEIAAASMIRP